MMRAAVPVAPRINVAELIRQSGIECGWDTSLTGGGVLTPQQAARALCGLSQEVDRSGLGMGIAVGVCVWWGGGT